VVVVESVLEPLVDSEVEPLVKLPDVPAVVDNDDVILTENLAPSPPTEVSIPVSNPIVALNEYPCVDDEENPVEEEDDVP